MGSYLQEMLAFLAGSLMVGPAVKNMALKPSTIFLSPPHSGKARVPELV